METDDQDLVRRAQRGDPAAFERLVRRFDARVLNLAWRLLLDAEAARDARQVAFLKAHRALPAFAFECRFETWLYRIVLNVCRDRRRAAAPRQRADLAVAWPPDAEDVANSPLPKLLQDERERAVRQAIGALPEAEREALVLRHWHDLPFPEIAALLGEPVTTIKSRVGRALARLSTMLEPEAAPRRADSQPEAAPRRADSQPEAAPRRGDPHAPHPL